MKEIIDALINEIRELNDEVIVCGDGDKADACFSAISSLCEVLRQVKSRLPRDLRDKAATDLKGIYLRRKKAEGSDVGSPNGCIEETMLLLARGSNVLHE